MTNEEKLCNYLNSLNIHTLRQAARHYGIYSPTTKVKPELIEEICDVLSGRSAPAVQSKRGAPIKEHIENSYVIDKIDSFLKPYQNLTTDKNSLSVRRASSELVYDGAVFSGLLIHGEEEDFLRSKRGERLPFSAALEQKYQLKEGDFVSVRIRDKEDFANYEILSINYLLADYSQKRLSFDLIDSFYPDRKFNFSLHDRLFRAIDLFAPLGRGQRVFVSCLPGTDRLTLTNLFLDALESNVISPLVLAVGISSEDEFELKKNERCEFFTTKFDEPAENSILEMRICTERAKRLCEEKKDVVLIVYSLFGAFGISDSLARTLFSLAKNGRENGSITVIAYSTGSENTLSWQEVANSVLCLSGSGLTLEPLKSETKRARLLRTDEENALEQALRQELEKGQTKRYRAWCDAESAQAFFKKEAEKKKKGRQELS